MYSYLIILLSIRAALATSTDDAELPMEAVNCIENFKITHIKWMPVYEQCKLAPTATARDRESEDNVRFLALLYRTNFRQCLGDEAVSDYDEAVRRCIDIGKTLSFDQQVLGQKLFQESMKGLV